MNKHKKEIFALLFLALAFSFVSGGDIEMAQAHKAQHCERVNLNIHSDFKGICNE